VADLLARAADILSEFEWRQGSAGSRRDGSMCAVGAIYEAASDFGMDDARAACAIMGRPSDPLEIWPLAKWNDAPGRTKAEVVAALRTASARTRATAGVSDLSPERLAG
jgi:hypothetical protein